MQLMSKFNTWVPTDASLIITMGDSIICCKWACSLTLSSTHVNSILCDNWGRCKTSHLVSRILRLKLTSTVTKFLTLRWHEYSNTRSSLWLKVKGGLLKTFPPTDGPQGPICWQDKQTLNDASQNDLAFKDPQQVVSNDSRSSAMCKHSILGMINCPINKGAFLKEPVPYLSSFMLICYVNLKTLKWSNDSYKKTPMSGTFAFVFSFFALDSWFGVLKLISESLHPEAGVRFCTDAVAEHNRLYHNNIVGYFLVVT